VRIRARKDKRETTWRGESIQPLSRPVSAVIRFSHAFLQDPYPQSPSVCVGRRVGLGLSNTAYGRWPGTIMFPRALTERMKPNLVLQPAWLEHFFARSALASAEAASWRPIPSCITAPAP